MKAACINCNRRFPVDDSSIKCINIIRDHKKNGKRAWCEFWEPDNKTISILEKIILEEEHQISLKQSLEKKYQTLLKQEMEKRECFQK